MSRCIDLNCDLGEGAGNDAALMPLLSSANIACGGHAGDAATMRATLRLAKVHGVAVGAHPSWPDRVDFGRREMAAPADEVFGWVVEQVRRLMTLAQAEDMRLAHVKTHGALYNQTARDPLLAEAVVRAVCAVDRKLIVFGLAGGHLIDAARAAGLLTATEIFADRRYRDDGTLETRDAPRALIAEPEEAARQVLQVMQTGEVITVNGRRIALSADTVCLHGDSPRAVEIARAVRASLTNAGWTIRAPGAQEKQL